MRIKAVWGQRRRPSLLLPPNATKKSAMNEGHLFQREIHKVRQTPSQQGAQPISRSREPCCNGRSLSVVPQTSEMGVNEARPAPRLIVAHVEIDAVSSENLTVDGQFHVVPQDWRIECAGPLAQDCFQPRP